MLSPFSVDFTEITFFILIVCLFDVFSVFLLFSDARSMNLPKDIILFSSSICPSLGISVNLSSHF